VLITSKTRTSLVTFFVNSNNGGQADNVNVDSNLKLKETEDIALVTILQSENKQFDRFLFKSILMFDKCDVNGSNLHSFTTKDVRMKIVGKLRKTRSTKGIANSIKQKCQLLAEYGLIRLATNEQNTHKKNKKHGGNRKSLLTITRIAPSKCCLEPAQFEKLRTFFTQWQLDLKEYCSLWGLDETDWLQRKQNVLSKQGQKRDNENNSSLSDIQLPANKKQKLN